ncbi:FG-GAP-like repeat-containing protein [Planctomycetota bacterium]
MNQRGQRHRKTQLIIETCEVRRCLSVTFGEPNTVVDTGSIGVNAVEVGDLDNDSDMDVVAASDEGIRWIENSRGEFRNSHVVIRSDYRVSQVAVADVDGDGEDDVAALVGGYVAWYKNLGQGEAFGRPQLISGAGNTKFTAGDLDSDGDIDFIVQSQISQLDRFVNDDANFSQADSMATALRIEDFRIRDVDEDGDQDILVATEDDVTLFENTSHNQFADENVLIADVRPDQVDVHDANHDGLVDIVYASWRGTAWHINRGNGSYSPAIVLSGQTQNIGIADINQDGTEDLVLSSWANDRISWTPFLQKRKYETFAIDTDVERAGEVFPLDLENDGDIDLISYSWRSGLTKYENLGAGQYAKPEQLAGQAFGTTDLRTGDIDGDGDLDLLAVARSRRGPQVSGIAWYENTDGEGTFSEQNIIDYKRDDRTVDAMLVDVDGDQDLDIVAGFGLVDRRSTAAEFVWYENTNGQGDFSAPKAIVETERRTGRKLAFADIDGDGDNDLVMGSAFPQLLQWFENQGDGMFSKQRQIDSAPFSEIVPVDLDTDGDVDLVVGQGFNMTWYENEDGLGSFGDAETIASNFNGLGAITAADLNGDGRTDLAVAHSDNDDMVAWYEHLDGTGTFSRRKRIAFLDAASSIDAADFDQDGDLDLIASSAGFDDGQVVWFENTNGKGNFKPTQVQQEADAIMSVVTGDFNGDGRIDAVSGTHRSGKIQWHKNLGIVGDANRDGIFDTADLVRAFQSGRYETGEGATEEQGDFNGDGKFDSSDLVFAFQSSAFID